MEASNIGVLLYFAAGLLPDPDTPFKPNEANLHSWVFAAAFEISLLITARITASVGHGPTRLEFTETALGCTKIAILVLMSVTYLAFNRQRANPDTGRDSEGETLINGSDKMSKYGTGPKTHDVVHGIQATGWLDYFVGFNVLFPYIWYGTYSGKPSMNAENYLGLLAQSDSKQLRSFVFFY